MSVTIGITERLSDSAHSADARARAAPVVRPKPDRRAYAFAAGLTALLAGLWAVAAVREGSWEQVSPWDQAWFHTIALRFKHSLGRGDFTTFAWEWVHYSKTHAPLVPTLSALLMLVFGETRHVAEMVLPLSTFVLVLSVFRVCERLYDRRTAYATAALTCAFPIALTLSRTYLFEHTFAALVAASCWAILASEGFTRLGPTIAFGVLAGLAALSRALGPVLLVGPTLVALFVALRGEGKGRRIAFLALATAIGIAVCWPWYGPNLKHIVTYVRSVTYGEKAAFYAGGQSGISLTNIRYALESNILEGPGVPMLALALIGYMATDLLSKGRLAVSPTMVAVATAWGIEFFLLLLASQKVGAVLFLPAMPMVALMVVRAVLNVPRAALRSVLALGVLACALHHVIAMSLTFPVPQGPEYGRGPFARGFDFADAPRGFPLWNHRLMWLDMAESVTLDPRTDFHLPEIVDRLVALGIPSTSNVYVLSDNPFCQVNSIRFEATRRGLDWTVNSDRGVAPPYSGEGAALKTIRSNLNAADAAVSLDKPERAGVGRGYAKAVARVAHSDARPFSMAGDPIVLDDGSIVRVFGRLPRIELRDDVPATLKPVSATFGDPGEAQLTLEGVSFDSLEPDDHLVTLCFRWNQPTPSFPETFAHFLIGDKFLRSYPHGATPIDPTRLAAGLRYAVVRIHVEGEIPDIVRARGFSIAVGVLAPKPEPGTPKSPRYGERLPVQSSLPTDEDGTRVYVWSVPPAEK